jgi:F420-dependent oxidoreductase-like protein
MRLGLNIWYATGRVAPPIDLVKEADRLGYHSVWAAEAYGSDTVTILSWLGAVTERIHLGAGIMQMPARTPAMTAMTAATLNELSGGRFLLGLGLSGPQVVEGWHGLPYGKPLAKTREYVSIVRSALARDRVQHAGDHYRIPYDGEDATGLGIPLKLTIHPTHDLPIYLAAIGPKNIALAGEIADGWLPVFWSPEGGQEQFGQSLRDGLARSGDPAKAERFDLAPTVPVVLTDDPDQARWGVRPLLALYIGGMGAKGQNFYTKLATRYGYGEAAEQIQDLYLSGQREAAMAAVPDALVDELCIIGPREAIGDRLDAWRESGVTTLIAAAGDLATVRVLAELML